MQRLPALDWIKAAAIVAVALNHGAPDVFAVGPVYGPMLAIAVTGFHVPAFLIVAGFLSGADRPLGFSQVGERLLRILPPYLVATAVASLLGWGMVDSVQKLVFNAVTGGAVGPYYFVPVLAGCFVLLPVLARLRVPTLIVVVVLLGFVADLMWSRPAWRISHVLYWQVRDPFLQFHFGNFVLGVLAARYRGTLVRGLSRHARWVAAIAAVLLAAAVAVAAAEPVRLMHPLARTSYAIVVSALLAGLASGRPAPGPVRFLSETTLTVYLYHFFAYARLKAIAKPWPLPLRMLALAAGGIALGSLVAHAGRRLLGRRSRLVLGA